VTGTTQSTDFPTTPGVFQRTKAGLSDAFVAKVDDPQGAASPNGGGGGGGGGSGCFIATAAFGSPLAQEVQTLRRFRDGVLLNGAPGRAFVRVYYRLSPPLAEIVAAHGTVRQATRLALRPLLTTAQFALAFPNLAGAAGSTILVGALVLAAWGAQRRRIVGMGLLLVVAVVVMRLTGGSSPDAEHSASVTAPRGDLTSPIVARPEQVAPATPSAQTAMSRPSQLPTPGDDELSRADLWELSRLLPNFTISVVPLPSPMRMRYWIKSAAVEGVMDGEDFSVIDPGMLGRFGIEPGDRIRRVDGWPVAGSLMVLRRLARDPDAGVVQVELVRQNTPMVQPLRLNAP